MKKQLWLLLPLAAILAILLFLQSKAFLIWEAKFNLEAMTAYATNPAIADGVTRFQGRNVEYWPDDDVVIFHVSYRGFGSSARMRGFCYSPSGAISSLGCDREQTPEGKGVKFRGEGDNWAYVEPIADHWCWFELNL